MTDKESNPPKRRLRGINKTVVAASLALALGFSVAPTVAFAGDVWYAKGLARFEDQKALSKQVTLTGARGGAASNYMRFHLVNTYSYQAQIASSVVDGVATAFSHARVTKAFSNCWWEWPDGDLPKANDQRIGVSCAFTN